MLSSVLIRVVLINKLTSLDDNMLAGLQGTSRLWYSITLLTYLLKIKDTCNVDTNAVG